MSTIKNNVYDNIKKRILDILGISAILTTIYLFVIKDPLPAFIILVITIIMFGIGSSYKYIQIILNKYIIKGYKIFHNRNTATPDMYREMLKSNKLVFIGISQSSLTNYIKMAIDLADDNSLSWRSIDIFFADDSVGHSWEENQFITNIINSKQLILETLFTNIYRFPYLEQVAFKQAQIPMTYGGSLFGRQVSMNIEPEFRIIYGVHYLPTPDANTKKSLTIKIKRPQQKDSSSDRNFLWSSYFIAYKTLLKNSISLGIFHPSVWDYSSKEWQNFCESYNGMNSSMKILINLANLNGSEAVLDVAGGNGCLSKYITEEIPRGELTILDASPGMISDSKKLLGTKSNVKYSICQLPFKDHNDFEISNKKYDRIFCHLSLGCIANSLQKVYRFASWSYKHLTPNGKIVFNAHNGILQIGYPKGFENWVDPFRKKIYELIYKNKFQKYLIDNSQPSYNENEIENIFKRCEFKLEGKKVNEFEITMNDRLLLWKVPAILNTIIDLKSLGTEKGKELVEDSMQDIINMPTMPRTIISWVFTKH